MKKLLPEVADKYKLVGVEPGKYQFNSFGVIDLTKLTLDEADAIVRIGFTHLVKREKKDKAS